MPDSADPAGDAPTDDGRRAAERTVRLAAVACALLVVAGLVAALTHATSNRDEPSPLVEGPAGTGAVTALGPAPRTDVEAYRAARSAALAALGASHDERVAVVSFTRYRTAADAAAAVAGVASGSSLHVVARLVAGPGGLPSFIGTDDAALRAWADGERAKAAADHDEIARLLPTVEPTSPYVPFYEKELRRLAALRDGTKADGEVVFAVVVKAPVTALVALAAHAPVRLVDVGPDAADPDPERTAGLLPDDAVTVSDPPTRPAPAT